MRGPVKGTIGQRGPRDLVLLVQGKEVRALRRSWRAGRGGETQGRSGRSGGQLLGGTLGRMASLRRGCGVGRSWAGPVNLPLPHPSQWSDCPLAGRSWGPGLGTAGHLP